jgi:uncharacterized protein (DUF2062 family)
LLSLFAARRLRLNPLSVLAGSHLSTGPIGPFLVLVSVALGHFLLHGSWPAMAHWRSVIASGASLRAFAIDWLLGSVLLGAAVSVATYALARAAFRLTRGHQAQMV